MARFVSGDKALNAAKLQKSPGHGSEVLLSARFSACCRPDRAEISIAGRVCGAAQKQSRKVDEACNWGRPLLAMKRRRVLWLWEETYGLQAALPACGALCEKHPP